MINFDKNKFPLDHEWKDIDDEKDFYSGVGRDKVFNKAYHVECIECGIEIFHRELNSKYIDFESILLYECNSFEIYKDEYIYSLHSEIVNFDNIIMYNKVLSCKEYIIKDLLE